MSNLTLTKTEAPVESDHPTADPFTYEVPSYAEVPEHVREDAEALGDEILLETAKRQRTGKVRGGRGTRTVRGWSMGGRVD